jgi:hypothetical protein
MDVHNFAGAGMVGGFDGVTVDGDVAFFDEALDRATRDGGKMLTQEYVEPLGGNAMALICLGPTTVNGAV